MSKLGAKNSNGITGIRKYTGTLKFEFYGEPSYSTTDVFRYELVEQFQEDPHAMLDGIEWSSEPIEIVTWTKGEIVNGKFIELESEQQ